MSGAQLRDYAGVVLFPNRAADREAALDFLDVLSRALSKAADSLDGAGLRAASGPFGRRAEKEDQ